MQFIIGKQKRNKICTFHDVDLSLMKVTLIIFPAKNVIYNTTMKFSDFLRNNFYFAIIKIYIYLYIYNVVI